MYCQDYPTGGRAPRRAESSAAFGIVFLIGALAAGCGGGATGSDGDRPVLVLEFEPSPPSVGIENVDVWIREPGGAPFAAASVHLEGNMNHAGMVPEFADATEVEPGHYVAELEFTMGGDWVLTVEATTPEGAKLRWAEEVHGVRSERE